MKILVPITHDLHQRNWLASGAVERIKHGPAPVEMVVLTPPWPPRRYRAIRDSLRLASMVERAKRGSSTYRHKLTLARPIGQRLQIRVWQALAAVQDVEALAVRLEARLPVSHAAMSLLGRSRLDLVLWPTMIHSDPADDLIKAAHVLGIPVVAAPASWDTLTTKGGFLIRPDRLLVWGQASAHHAERDHGFLPAGQITVTGPPHWDHYLEPRAQPPRDTILVAGTTLHYWADEAAMVERLQAGFGDRIVHRPHPRAGAGWSWPMMLGLRDQLDRATHVVAAFSTVIIEAALLGIPSAVVAFGQLVSATGGTGGLAEHVEYEHMADVLRWPGVTTCRSFNELLRAVDGPMAIYAGALRECARAVADVDGHCQERIAGALVHG